MPDLLHAIGRERAVIAGFLIAVLEAVVAGEITKATAVPVIGGIALRFFVTPSYRHDDRDVDDPRGIAADG